VQRATAYFTGVYADRERFRNICPRELKYNDPKIIELPSARWFIGIFTFRKIRNV